MWWPCCDLLIALLRPVGCLVAICGLPCCDLLIALLLAATVVALALRTRRFVMPEVDSSDPFKLITPGHLHSTHSGWLRRLGCR